MTEEKNNKPVVVNNGEFKGWLDSAAFEHAWRIAQVFASSTLVPEHFKGKPADVLIVVQMAMRLGIDPFMALQNTYVYKGKIGLLGQFVIALINSSQLYTGSLSFELEGEGADLSCTAWAIEKKTGERKECAINMHTVKANGWDSNTKWKTMPEQMLKYRAGAWFARLHCPERLAGMQTVEEIEDVIEVRANGTSQSTEAKSLESALLDGLVKPADSIDQTTSELDQDDKGDQPQAVTKQLDLEPEVVPDEPDGQDAVI